MEQLIEKPGATEPAATRAGNQAILGKGQDLELLAHLASIALIDRVCSPFEQLRIPCRTVIQRIRRYSAHDVVWAGSHPPDRRRGLVAVGLAQPWAPFVK